MTDRDRLIATRLALRKLIQAEPPASKLYDEFAYRRAVESYRVAMESILKEYRDEDKERMLV